MKRTKLPQRYIPTDRVVWRDGSPHTLIPTTIDLELVNRAEQFYDNDMNMTTECTLLEIAPTESLEPYILINLPYDVFETFFNDYREYWYKRSGTGLAHIN